MSHDAAACVTALRAAMEALVVEVTKDPEIISQLDPVNERMLNVIRQISRPSAAGINLMAGNTRLAPICSLIQLDPWSRKTFLVTWNA